MKYEDFEIGSIIKVTNNGEVVSDIIKTSDSFYYSINEREEFTTGLFFPEYKFEKGSIKEFDSETISCIIHDLCRKLGEYE